MLVSILNFASFCVILTLGCLRSYNLGFNDGYKQFAYDMEEELKKEGIIDGNEKSDS